MFTWSYYSQLVEELKKKSFAFRTFSQADSGKEVLLRHDVDYSLDLAVEFAEFEATLGVTSTYFVLLDAPFYSLTESALKKIQNAGHEIGLHYEIQERLIDSSSIREQLRRLEKWTGSDLTSFSFHRPAHFSAEGVEGLFEEYSGLRSAYSPIFFAKERYLSDSNHHWRVGDPLRFIQKFEGQRLQMLTHPVWWTKEPETKENKLKRAVRPELQNLLPH